jgi:outer membrane protein OmpA-like peptidoglycan-associated protein
MVQNPFLGAMNDREPIMSPGSLPILSFPVPEGALDEYTNLSELLEAMDKQNQTELSAEAEPSPSGLPTPPPTLRSLDEPEPSDQTAEIPDMPPPPRDESLSSRSKPAEHSEEITVFSVSDDSPEVKIERLGSRPEDEANAAPSAASPSSDLPPEIEAAEVDPAPDEETRRTAGSAEKPAPLRSPGAPPQGKSIDNLSAEEIEQALQSEDGTEIAVDGSLYVWRDNYLYRRRSDGSLEPTGSSLGPDDTSYDAESGQNWLSHEADGSFLIRVSLRVWATINFEYNSAELLQESNQILLTFSQALNRPALKDRRLLIIGHTDNRGPDEFNMRLSRRRASAVGQWLTEKGGIASDRLVLTGYGATMPVADNETDEGRAENRRVEFVLLQ